MTRFFTFLWLFICLIQLEAIGQITIRNDFPGGNIILDSIVGNKVYVRPDQKGTDVSKGGWFYWYFEVRAAQGRQVQFVFNRQHTITSKGPAYSRDGAASWNFLNPSDSIETDRFDFTFLPTDTVVRFCMTIPYVKSDFEHFINDLESRYSSFVGSQLLAKTPRRGDSIWLHTLQDPNQKPTYTLLVTARHHACESTASYVLEGMMESFLSLLSDGNQEAKRVRMLVLPFMDLDGVELGEQGKNRAPHDHNRDYFAFQHTSTGALSKAYDSLTRGTRVIALDLHSPWIKYSQNETLFFVGQEKDEMNEKIRILAAAIEYLNKGELPFSEQTAIFPFGTDWNSTTLEKNKTDGLLSFSRWNQLQSNNIFATTLEVSYANVSGTVVSKENLRAFGNVLLRAMLAVYPDL